MRQPNVTVYGSHSCPDTNRATRFLEGREIPYEFKSVDDFPEYNSYIAELNEGQRITPTIQVNNEVFINPSEADLGAAVEKAVQAANA
jgi:thioredoxin reductase (NADPH)